VGCGSWSRGVDERSSLGAGVRRCGGESAVRFPVDCAEEADAGQTGRY
jgi:hypothetical protein